MSTAGRIPWPGWFNTAPCAGMSDVFFPDDPTDTAPAKAVCSGCEFKRSCLEWGLAHAREDWAGVYGGLTLNERIKVRGGRGTDRPLSFYCGRGHEYTAENTGLTNRGARRCLACKRANDASHRDKNRRTTGGTRSIPTGPVPHGTTDGYRNHRCRCKECCAANTEAVGEWRARRRAS